MSSIVEAAEEVVQEKFGVFKCILYSLPLFGTYVLQKNGLTIPYHISNCITSLLLLAISKIIINNVRNCKDYVHPKNGIFGVIGEAIKLFFVMLPITAILGTIGYYLSQIQVPQIFNNAQNVYILIITAILGSMLLASFIFYAKTNKIKDAYNIRGILQYCTDIFVTVLFGLPRLFLLNLVTFGVVTYIFYFFFGLDNYYYAYACCLATAFNVAIFAHFLAQVDYETVKHDDNEEDTTNTLDTF